MKSLIQTFPRSRPEFCMSLSVFISSGGEERSTLAHKVLRCEASPLKTSDFVANLWRVAVDSLVTPGSRGGGWRVIQQQRAQG